MSTPHRPRPARALVTGAGSGIGLATCLELARRGHEVSGTVRSTAQADRLHRRAADVGTVRAVHLDVTDAEGCAEVAAEVRPDVLVNNAGLPVVGAIEDLGDADAREALETMAIAPMRLARLCLPRLREQGWGRIVQVSSIYGRVETPFMGWYQAAKQALEAATDALRIEVADAGVVVTMVEPGAIDTPLWRKTRERLTACAGRHEHRYGVAAELSAVLQPMFSDAGTVAERIATLVDDERPPARLLVGWDARVLSVVDRVTPAPVSDRVLRLLSGL